MWKNALLLSLGLLLFFVAAQQSGCDPDSAAIDQGSAPPCFANPTTHVEFINSCTDAVAIDRPARLAKFRPGAPLEPLPN
jgi:hypothetical protein